VDNLVDNLHNMESIVVALSKPGSIAQQFWLVEYPLG